MSKFIHILFALFSCGAAFSVWLTLDTHRNTSYVIASKHIINIYNRGCYLSKGKKFYITWKNKTNYNVTHIYPDGQYGMWNETLIVQSDSINNIITQNQFSQYSMVYPGEDDYGMYINDGCEKIVYEKTLDYGIICVLFAIIYLLVLIIYYLCISKKSNSYEGIN